MGPIGPFERLAANRFANRWHSESFEHPPRPFVGGGVMDDVVADTQ